MSRTLTLPENKQGRDFVVGDIHGAYDLLIEAMEEAKFDPAVDRLISVGDLVDRGPDSPVSLWLLQQPWFHAVRGNHEDIFLDVVNPDGSVNLAPAFWHVKHNNGIDWIAYETPETLAAMHAAFSKLPYAIEIKTDRGNVGFIHAEVPAGMHWSTFKKKLDANDEDTINAATWSRTRVEHGDDSGVPGIDRLFSGHTIQENGPQRLGNVFYIDTGAVFRQVVPEKFPQNFITLTDIRANADDITGPAKFVASKKVVVNTPRNGKPFKADGPR